MESVKITRNVHVEFANWDYCMALAGVLGCRNAQGQVSISALINYLGNLVRERGAEQVAAQVRQEVDGE